MTFSDLDAFFGAFEDHGQLVQVYCVPEESVGFAEFEDGFILKMIAD